MSNFVKNFHFKIKYFSYMKKSKKEGKISLKKKNKWNVA